MMVCARSAGCRRRRVFLVRAPEYQHPKCGSHRANDRTNNENSDGQQHDRAPAMDIAQLSKQRRRRSRGEEIRRHHPGKIIKVSKAFADRRQSGRDDGLLQSREKHCQHDPNEDGANGGMVERSQNAGVFVLPEPTPPTDLAYAPRSRARGHLPRPRRQGAERCCGRRRG